MKTRIHAVMGFVATVTVALFFLSTVIVELNGDKQSIAQVKQLIVYGLFVLVPAMIVTGISGTAVVGSRRGRLIKTKMKRVRVIAANGVLILIPCALVLNEMAAASVFNAIFYAVQGVELIAGAINIWLMGLNIRDGLLLTGRIRKKRPLVTNRGA